MIPEALPRVAVVTVGVTDLASQHWVECAALALGYVLGPVVLVEGMLVVRYERASAAQPDNHLQNDRDSSHDQATSPQTGKEGDSVKGVH